MKDAAVTAAILSGADDVTGRSVDDDGTKRAAFLFDDNNWHFGLAPEVGVTFPLGWRVAGFGMVRYNYAFSSGGTGAIQYWGINLGVAWR